MPRTNTDISENTLANLAYEQYLAKKAQIATLDFECGLLVDKYFSELSHAAIPPQFAGGLHSTAVCQRHNN